MNYINNLILVTPKGVISLIYKCKSFELDYIIPSDIQSGNWWIYSVALQDRAGNTKFLKNYDSTKYNFNVVSDTSDTTVPSIDKINILNKK